MKKCFIYYRVSSEKQTEKSGIERQEHNLREYVERNKLCNDMDDPMPVEIHDSGVSGWKGLNMSEGNLGRWMKEVRAGMWDSSLLILESIDRFSRENPFTVLGYINELVAHKITIHDTSLNMQINLGNSALLPMVTMSAQRAYEESKIKSDRIRDGWKRKRTNAFNNGTIVTNKSPKWISIEDNRYVLNGGERIVKEVYRLYQSGIGTTTIARILNEKGDEWYFTNKWRSESIHKLLKNRRVTGVIYISEIIRDYNSTENPVDQKRYEMMVYPQVISEDEFNIVQKLLVSRRNVGRTTSKNNQLSKSNIFNSIVRCGLCGEAMYHNVVGKYRYFRCIAERDNLCTNKALRYDIVERFIVEHIRNVDFKSLVESNETDPRIELLKLSIIEEKKHIEEYEVGIERLRNNNKKVPFDVLIELEESNEKLNGMENELLTLNDMHVDVDALSDFSIEEVVNIENVELRSRIENELRKVVKRIEMIRMGDNYVVTIKYDDLNVLQHVLIIQGKKIPVLISNVSIVRTGASIAYITPSFTIRDDDGIELIGVPDIIDYSLLLNYVDGVEGCETIAIWMRNKFNSFEHVF